MTELAGLHDNAQVFTFLFDQCFGFIIVSKQAIKDRNDGAIGYIETLSDGRHKATNQDSRTLGWFDPKRNVTTDPNNRTIAKANVLSGLIYDQR